MIHPKGKVERPDLISPEGTIWQFASITGETIIGAETVVSPFAMLHGPLIGKRCRISGGVMMGPGFVIGDDVFIGPNVTLCNDAWPRTHKDGYDAETLYHKPPVGQESQQFHRRGTLIHQGFVRVARPDVAFLLPETLYPPYRLNRDRNRILRRHRRGSHRLW